MHKINLYIKFLVTWREQDSNLRPRDYEPRELPNCSTPRINFEAHCRIRTDDICFTKAMLWPTELSRQNLYEIKEYTPIIIKRNNIYDL